MLDQPRVVVNARLSDRVEFLCADTSIPYDFGLIEESLARLIEDQSLSPIVVEVVKPLPEHAGFGSRTATTLAVLTAATLACSVELGRSTLQRSSGRGGTSGTGIHGFFEGGWIVDAGQRRPVPLAPSRAQQDRPPSLLVSRVAPANWTIGLLLPSGGRVSGPEEVELFRSSKVVREEVLIGVSDLYHGMLPALIEEDFDAFSAALTRYQSIGFKAAEIAAQGARVSLLIRALRRTTPCVGMSSVGPLVFAMAPTPAQVPEWANIADEMSCKFWTTSIAGRGWSDG